MENKPQVIIIQGVEVERDYIKIGFRDFFNEILVSGERDEIDFFKSKYNFDLVDIIVDNFERIWEIAGNKELADMELPLNKLDDFFNAFSLENKLASYDDNDGRLQALMRKLLMAFFMYFEKSGQPNISVDIYKFFNRTVTDVSDRFEAELPQEIISLLERLRKRTDAITAKEQKVLTDLEELLSILGKKGIIPKDFQIQIQAIVNNGNGNIQNIGNSSDIDANINI